MKNLLVIFALTFLSLNCIVLDATVINVGTAASGQILLHNASTVAVNPYNKPMSEIKINYTGPTGANITNVEIEVTPHYDFVVVNDVGTCNFTVHALVLGNHNLTGVVRIYGFVPQPLEN
ncbi:hypothetical protein DMENIID0001_056640 [Sergentomyia squamirostris]